SINRCHGNSPGFIFRHTDSENSWRPVARLGELAPTLPRCLQDCFGIRENIQGKAKWIETLVVRKRKLTKQRVWHQSFRWVLFDSVTIISSPRRSVVRKL